MHRIYVCGAVAQLIERYIRIVEAEGLSPFSSTTNNRAKRLQMFYSFDMHYVKDAVCGAIYGLLFCLICYFGALALAYMLNAEFFLLLPFVLFLPVGYLEQVFGFHVNTTNPFPMIAVSYLTFYTILGAILGIVNKPYHKLILRIGKLNAQM